MRFFGAKTFFLENAIISRKIGDFSFFWREDLFFAERQNFAENMLLVGVKIFYFFGERPKFRGK